MSSNGDSQEEATLSTRQDILALLDGFIQQIHSIRRILLGMSISTIVLGPLAIALSIYLFLHPSFFAILERENEFGLVLTMLLVAVIIISGIWLVTGIRQYDSMSQWKKRYEEYLKEKEAIDRKIASQFGLLDQE
jgi:uncharacterized membrane protein